MSERWSKKRIKEVNAEMADQILIEIGLTLEVFECAHGQGTHTAQLTPSMFYPEWIACIAAKSNARITELEAENARLRGELEEIEIRARMAQGWDDNLADEVRAYMLCDIMRHIEQYARAALQEETK